MLTPLDHSSGSAMLHSRQRIRQSIRQSTRGTTMPALNLDTDHDRIAERVHEPDTLFVACLCAEWCGTCREYREAFDKLAERHPQICFAWIDIETHADRFDDLDVE